MFFKNRVTIYEYHYSVFRCYVAMIKYISFVWVCNIFIYIMYIENSTYRIRVGVLITIPIYSIIAIVD